MPNFEVKIRNDYQDTTGLVLDLRPAELASIEGTHDGDNDASTLVDSTKSWIVDEHVGKIVCNLTDKSRARITANTATEIIATLAGGLENDWDDGDVYTVQGDADGVLRWKNMAPAARIVKPEYSGTHDGANNAATLSDSTAPWAGMSLAGMAVYNLTDGSLGWITANDDDSVTATLAGGTDNDWDTGDTYQIAAPRFGDAYCDSIAYQPAIRTIDGIRLAEFTKTLLTRLYVPLEHGFPESWWTVAVEVWNGSDTDAPQAIVELGGTTVVEIWRIHTVGSMAIAHGTVSYLKAGDHPDGVSVLQGIPASDVDYWNNGVVYIDNGTPFQPATVVSDDKSGWIGGSSVAGGSQYFDGRIRSVRAWNRPLSVPEIEFLFRTLSSAGTDYSPAPRVGVSVRAWTDDTTSSLGDWKRVTGQLSMPERFLVAQVPITSQTTQAKLQLAASVDGKVRPDSELGGKLFRLDMIEFPAAVPMIEQESGWSSVFDLTLDARYPGHYSCMISRENGGGVIVHFDVEALA